MIPLALFLAFFSAFSSAENVIRTPAPIKYVAPSLPVDSESTDPDGSHPVEPELVVPQPVVECNYYYGSSTTMSAWIRHDDYGKASIYWKGIKIATGVTATRTYSANGYRYNLSGSYKNLAKMNERGDYYYYYTICRTEL